MNPTFEYTLTENYPRLYIGVTKPLTESLMGFGFECGDGWFKLIERLSTALTELNEETVAIQVKEKYGTLRFYIIGGSDEAYNLIDKAEKESAKTCEECGDVGELRRLGYWLKTLCAVHYAKWGRRDKEEV